MAINVVPVTGSGGGVGAPQQGKSSAGRLQLSPYVAPRSGLNSFSDSFSPYMMAAMKRYQEQKDRRGLAGLMAGTKVGDRSGLLQGEFANPAAYQSMANTDAANALKTAQMNATQENVRARIDSKNQNTALIQSMMNNRQTAGFGQEKEMENLKTSNAMLMDNNKATNALTKIGKLHINEMALLGESKGLDYKALKFTQGSIDKRQVYDLDFKDGQNGNKRKHDREMKVLQDKLTQGRDSNMFSNDMEKQEYLSSVKERMQMKKHAFDSGENNLNRTSQEVINEKGLASAEKITAMRGQIKTNIANIQEGTKRWSTEYKEKSKQKMQTNEFGYKNKERVSDQEHDLLLKDIGHKYNKSMATINGKIKRESAYLNQEFTTINKEIDRATGQDKIRLTKELDSVAARIKHNEDKEMAGVNAYLKEEMGLKFIAFERKTKVDVAEIAAKATEYKARQGDVRLAGGMRKEFNSMTDDFITGLEPVYMNAREAFRKNSPAGDKAILFAYARYLKPDSTELRKHTVETLQNMSGLPGFVRDLWRKVSSGKEILNPAERNDIMSRLEIFHGEHQKSYSQKLEAYKQIALDSGVDPKLIKDMSLSRGLEPYDKDKGEGTGATEPGPYNSDTGIPGAGIVKGALNMFGGMSDDPVAGGEGRRESDKQGTGTDYSGAWE
jgi:hypothetical protein